ncbi:DUF397 domain-containing protein [Streptomyces sp. JJ38]|uniref:DUF397 domain-containing protein n=1 Tax=Streptomyces sp. JJ38 TaxID=2738128 RepID=UPI001C586A22|nr:DUF397 domain-containing protein [Streptomyces sp. JJ38]MBW1596400.1 DUF397 domain-containing protein [Streptomyces sp. JJ38]
MSHKPLDLSTAVWCKSSRSNNTGGNCVEVARDFPGAARWRKSSHSDKSYGACVEVADGCEGVVPVRDSKRAGGDVLVFPAAAWAAFVADVSA